ncbi:MAG TPA: SMP-30/gluconolactonase/LRE family protein [Polyangiaceae bacterium]|nr:SMP-30/gluconolactonase/LRE family protein [Polyangiaceae bacterium]
MRLAIVPLLFLAVGCATTPSLQIEPESLPPAVKDLGRQIDAVHRRRPNDGAVLYWVAAVHAQAGHREQALAALEKMHALGAGLDPRPDDFGALKDDPKFHELKARIRRAHPPVLRARVAYTVDGEWLGEGVAYSGATRKLYSLGSKGQIIAVAEDGTVEQLVAAKTGGLAGALGFRVDDARGELWVVSNALGERKPEMVLGLFRFRLGDGALLKAYPIERADKDLLNDVAVAPDGTAYATASNSGAVWAVPPGADAATKFVDGLPDPNGIAVTPDGRFLIVAGWHGITRVDVATKKAHLLEQPADVASGCIDGLYLYKTDIIGVQNCVHDPGRVMRYRTAGDWSRIVSAEVLESYNPHFDGIATGAIDGDSLLLHANMKGRKRTPPVPMKVLRVPLAP